MSKSDKKSIMPRRASGILCSITSLPSDYGIGDLGPSAYQFADFLKKSDQLYWQILPVNPTDAINGHSPYSCCSAFAGNTLFISPELLKKDGLVTAEDLKALKRLSKKHVDYPRVVELKEHLLQIAYQNFKFGKNKEPFRRFCRDHSYWLEDFALFIVLKKRFNQQAWISWPKEFRHRRPAAVLKISQEAKDSIERIKFEQFLFYKQWGAWKKYCHSLGVKIIGDIPVYVGYDSADVWCHPEIFQLNPDKTLKFIGGVPPDYFSETGQCWGTPLYRWEKMKQNHYQWWVVRVAHNLRLFDFIRIDHFRSFASYWQIPAGETTAVNGHWVKGPRDDFFHTLKHYFPHVPIIAEDLGEITPDVPALMEAFKFPGMRVLLFGFGGNLNDNPHLPQNYPVNCVVYTGTHDNNTVRGWWHKDATHHERENLSRYLENRKISEKTIHWLFINIAMESKAQTVIIPLQDVIGLSEAARMNTPGTQRNNWQWRFGKDLLKPEIARKMRALSLKTQRSSFHSPQK